MLPASEVHDMVYCLEKKKQLSEGNMKTTTLQVTVSGRAIGTPIFSQRTGA